MDEGNVGDNRHEIENRLCCEAGNSRGTNVVDSIKHGTECIGKLLNLPPGTLWPICRVWKDLNADGWRHGKWVPGAGRTADPGIWQGQATAIAQIPPEC